MTIGILITDEDGTNIYGTNSRLKGYCLTIFPNRTFEIVIQFPAMILASGHYNLTVSFHTGRNTAEKCFHWLEKAFPFEVVKEGDQDFIGVADLHAGFEFIPYSK